MAWDDTETARKNAATAIDRMVDQVRENWGADFVDAARGQMEQEGVVLGDLNDYFAELSRRVDALKQGSENVVSLDMAKATRGAGRNDGQQNQQSQRVAQLG